MELKEIKTVAACQDFIRILADQVTAFVMLRNVDSSSALYGFMSSVSSCLFHALQHCDEFKEYGNE